MEKSKFVSRYVGSMAGIATLQAVVAFHLLVRPELAANLSRSATRLLPFLDPIPKAIPGIWWTLAGAYLVLQGIGFFCAALFPKRWAYRAFCLLSSTTAAVGLSWVYSRDQRFAPILLGAFWQSTLSLWVAWLLLLEIVQRPFAPPPASAAPTPSL